MPLHEFHDTDLKIGECKSATECLSAVATIANSDMAVAIVLIDTEGNYRTYQHGCIAQDMIYCATALTEWYSQMLKAERV
jgi:hypothetical protein